MTIHRRVTVLPGGAIQLEAPELPAGAEAEVVVRVEDQQEESPEEPEQRLDTKPFWEKILERSARIPKEESEKMPRDLSINLDHYLYGAPKEE